MTPETDAFPAQAGGAFPRTQWSMIVRAGAESSPEAQSALEHLCQRYWYPLYAFIRRQGRSHHESEDCTQAFLAHLLTGARVSQARQEQGRFRTFLLTALRNFLTNAWHRAQAAKRGGGEAHLSLDFTDADRSFGLEPSDPALTPEQSFDRSWALGMIDRSIAEVRRGYEKSGRGALFGALAPFVWGDGKEGSLATAAAQLQMTTHAFTVALHRLRQRVGERLRADIAETVADESEVDAELRYLIAAVSRRATGR